MVITLTQYKSYAGILNPKTDDKLQFIVDFVNDFIINYCNTSFTPVEVRGARATSSGFDVVLPHAPILSVKDVRVSGKSLDCEQFILDKVPGVIEFINPVSAARLGIEIDYTHGHDSIPADLLLSALEFVTHLHKREFNKARSLGGGESSDYGDPELLPPQVRIGLNIHKVL